MKALDYLLLALVGAAMLAGILFSLKRRRCSGSCACCPYAASCGRGAERRGRSTKKL